MKVGWRCALITTGEPFVTNLSAVKRSKLSAINLVSQTVRCATCTCAAFDTPILFMHTHV